MIDRRMSVRGGHIVTGQMAMHDGLDVRVLLHPVYVLRWHHGQQSDGDGDEQAEHSAGEHGCHATRPSALRQLGSVCMTPDSDAPGKGAMEPRWTAVWLVGSTSAASGILAKSMTAAANPVSGYGRRRDRSGLSQPSRRSPASRPAPSPNSAGSIRSVLFPSCGGG